MKRFLLRGALIVLLALVLTNPATAQLVQTVEVGSGGTPVANGAALLAAYAGVPGSAGPTEPWVVKVDAGIFDLGGAQLVLRNFVDLEGSGRNATFVRSTLGGITSTDGTINVPAGVNAEIRSVTVQNRSAASGAAVINNSTELKLSTANLEVDVVNTGIGYLNLAGNARLAGVFSRVVADGIARGFQVAAGGPIINEAFVFVASFGTDNTGFLAAGTSAPLVQDLAVVVLGASARNHGISVRDDAEPRFVNTRVSSSGGTQTRGILTAEDAVVEIEESLFEAANTAGNALGLRAVEQSRVLASDSRFVGNTGISNDATVEATSSTTQGDVAAVVNSTNAARSFFGASQLDGPVAAAPLGILQCAYSYDGNFVELATNCL